MIIFAGPSLSKEANELICQSGHRLFPPVERGDISKLINQSKKTPIVIVDGLFHQTLAVGHTEIMDALARGWKIYGVSSIGAIRAYELRNQGMIGFGRVYQRFLDEEDFQDDEVALLHLPEPMYIEVSEPLVHFRFCIEDLVDRSTISLGTGKKVIGDLKKMYFGDRTMEIFKKLLQDLVNIPFEKLVPDFDKYRVKKLDLLNFLKQFQS